MQDHVNGLTRAVLAHADEERDRLLRELRESTSAALADFRKTAEETEDRRFREEAARVENAATEKYETLRMAAHREILIHREELTDRLREAVREALTRYVGTPEYEEHLAQKAGEIARKYAGETLFIEVCRKEDVPALREYAAVRLAEEDFIGGFRLGIPARRIVVDESLRSRMEDAFREFHEIRIESEENEA